MRGGKPQTTIDNLRCEQRIKDARPNRFFNTTPRILNAQENVSAALTGLVSAGTVFFGTGCL
jgi:hypothetical protein